MKLIGSALVLALTQSSGSLWRCEMTNSEQKVLWRGDAHRVSPQVRSLAHSQRLAFFGKPGR
jgi:hypothetical protein